ncbi:unnamed protein product [Alopecurus aequalis]
MLLLLIRGNLSPPLSPTQANPWQEQPNDQMDRKKVEVTGERKKGFAQERRRLSDQTLGWEGYKKNWGIYRWKNYGWLLKLCGSSFRPDPEMIKNQEEAR